MDTAKVFKSGNSQAVRLPKKFRFRGKEAYIKKLGDGIYLYPKTKDWKPMIDALQMFSDDFVKERNQPPIDKREKLFK